MKLKVCLFLAVAVMAVVGCNSKKENAKEEKKITIASVDGWAEGEAMTAVTKAILEENGYQVDVKKAAVDLIFASLANGDTDVFMDTWLPVTHGSKVAKFSGKIESLGVNYKNAKIGLVVPEYVEINSIDELNSSKDKFENKIIGIEKGAGITAKTDIAVKEYNLQLDYLNSSSIAMLTELKKAITEERWVVITGWAPHWKFGRFKLKFLEDPKGIYGASELIETYARKGFKEEDPFAGKYFANFSLTDEEMSDLLAKMEESSNKKEEAAKKWVADNKSLVESWLK